MTAVLSVWIFKTKFKKSGFMRSCLALKILLAFESQSSFVQDFSENVPILKFALNIASLIFENSKLTIEKTREKCSKYK